MKIVIEIPDKIYNTFHRGNWSATYEGKKIRDIVMNGTPLPEHHGDLIDRNRICKAIYAAEDNCTGMGMTYDEMDIYNDGINAMWDKLQNAPTIIEADKESES